MNVHMTESPLLDSEDAMLGVFLDCVVDFRKWLLRGRKTPPVGNSPPTRRGFFAQGFSRGVRQMRHSLEMPMVLAFAGIGRTMSEACFEQNYQAPLVRRYIAFG